MPRKMKPNDYKYYIGDVNLEYGGKFYNLSDWDNGRCDVLEIVDLSDCGFRGAVRIELGTIDVEQDPTDALECCGIESEDLAEMSETDRRLWIADALVNYWGIAVDWSDTSYIVQADSNKDYAPMEYMGMEAKLRLRSNQDVFTHIRGKGLLKGFK